MKGAGVQYLIVIEMVVRMEKECKNTNEEENMKKNVKKVISFILSMLVIISTAVTPAMAAGTKEAPTEVKSVTASGLWTTVLNLEFEDTTWMDNINKVIVLENGEEYLVLDKVNYQDTDYYYIAKVNESETDIENDYKLVVVTEKDNNKVITEVTGEEKLKEILPLFESTI